MSQTLILYPLFAMFVLSVVIAVRVLQLRYRAVFRDNLNPLYFKLNRGGKPPESMVQAEQHFTNLFETPVLFYVIVILIFVLKMTSIMLLMLAWLYVATRLLHAWIHMGKNRILRRRNIFLFNILILVLLWLAVFIELIRSPLVY